MLNLGASNPLRMIKQIADEISADPNMAKDLVKGPLKSANKELAAVKAAEQAMAAQMSSAMQGAGGNEKGQCGSCSGDEGKTQAEGQADSRPEVIRDRLRSRLVQTLG